VLVWVAKMTGARLVVGQRVERLLPPQQQPAPTGSAHGGGAAGGQGDAGFIDLAGTGGQVSCVQGDSTATPGATVVVAAEAEAEVVWLDREYRPVRVPGSVRASLEPLLRAKTAADADVRPGLHTACRAEPAHHP
jgi:hypothetical protein